MAKVSPRDLITMQCTVCKAENKRTSKNKKNQQERLELNIFCPVCGKHTPHKEKK